MKNTPYVKKYDKFGNVTNPIKTGYLNDFPNRKERREPLQKEKLFGRIPQYLRDKKTGKLKRILHTKIIS